MEQGDKRKEKMQNSLIGVGKLAVGSGGGFAAYKSVRRKKGLDKKDDTIIGYLCFRDVQSKF